MNIQELRNQFPQLDQKVYGKPLVYLDNAATSLRPISVIEKWDEISSSKTANLHRAVHHIANLATEEFESTRACVADFLGGVDASEIVFTSGTTMSINLVASSFGELLSEGDEIIIAESEHHSNIVPWQLLAARKGLKINVLPVDDDGELIIERLEDLITPKTRLCCVAQVSNVLGIINPIEEIVNYCHSKGCLVLVDGAQGVVHSAVNIPEMGCDFYAFSAHKIYGATGVGVLYGRKELLEKMPPYMGGGEMIGEVKWDNTTYAAVPHKFEAGTQNISGVPALKPALELAQSLRDPYFADLQEEIIAYLNAELSNIQGLTLYGNPADPSRKIPLFSFAVEGAHHEDLALILDKMGIAVRSGQMCAEPLMDRFGVSGMLRASFAPYNTLEEAKYFVESLHKAIKMLR